MFYCLGRDDLSYSYCCCLEPLQFFVTPTDDKKKHELHAIEKSSCCIRYCCGSIRPWTTTVHYDNLKGPVFATYERPYRAMPACCKLCCCYQYMTAKDAGGKEFGNFKET